MQHQLYNSTKMNFCYIFFSIFSVLSVFLLGFNSIFYPTFTVKHLGVSSLAIFIIYSLVSLIFLFLGYVFIPKMWSKINKKIILPLLLVLSVVLILLERINYQNYVLEHLHIFPYSFIYVLLFSLVIFYISAFSAKKNTERKIRVLFPIIFLILYYIWIEHYSIFESLIKEDSVLEYLQFIFYFLAAYWSFRIFLLLKNIKNKSFYSILFLLLSLGLFFVSFEEISYGQRIFGFNTPKEIKEVNLQNETNIHNLFSYDTNQKAYILIGLYGFLSRIILIKFFPKKSKNLIMFTPPLCLSLYFIFLFLIYYDKRFLNLYYNSTVSAFRRYAVLDWLEIAELYLALAFWYYTKITYKEIFQKQGSREKKNLNSSSRVV